MQLSDILESKAFQDMGPDEQERILDTYEAAVREESFTNNFDMQNYLAAKQEVNEAKTAFRLNPDPRNGMQILKDEFVAGLSNAAMAATALQAASGLVDPEKAAARLAEDDAEAQARPQSRALREYQVSGSKGWHAPIVNLFTNPAAVPLIMAQAAGTSVPSLVAGGAVGLAAGKYTKDQKIQLLAAMTGIGATSGLVEGGSQFLEDLREEAGGNLQDREMVASILNDAERMEKLKTRAATRGAVVGLFDAASVATPLSLLYKTSKTLKGLAVAGVGNAAIQGMLGMGGEVAGDVAIGETPNPADAWAEFIGEMGPGMIEVGIGGAGRLIPQTEQAVRDKIRDKSPFSMMTDAPSIRPGELSRSRDLPGVDTARGSAAQEEPQDPPSPVDPAAASAPGMEDESETEIDLPEQKPVAADQLREEDRKRDSGLVFLNSRYGPFGIAMETTAKQLGFSVKGTKVATTPEEMQLLDEEGEDYNENPDVAQKKDIDNADFAIVIGNPKTLVKDIGQTRFRNYALDKQARDKTFAVFTGRSVSNLKKQIYKYLDAFPGQKRFVIIGPHDRNLGTGKAANTAIREADAIGRELLQAMLDRSDDPLVNAETIKEDLKRSGNPEARNATFRQMFINSINPLRFGSRGESARRLKAIFDPAINPAARSAVLVAPTDIDGRHARDLGPIALELGAKRGQVGYSGSTYMLPLWGEPAAATTGMDRQGNRQNIDLVQGRRRVKEFYNFARNNPGLDFWFMVGAARSGFSKAQEVALLRDERMPPANVRFISSTLDNVWPETGRVESLDTTFTRVQEIEEESPTGEKTTRKIRATFRGKPTPTILGLGEKIQGEQAFDPNSRDNELTILERIMNKGTGILDSLILSEREVLRLLRVPKKIRARLRRQAVGSTEFKGQEYDPQILPEGIRVSEFPFPAKGEERVPPGITRYVKLKVLGVEKINLQDEAELMNAAAASGRSVDNIRQRGLQTPQYRVDLELWSPDIENSVPGIYIRKSKKLQAALEEEEFLGEDSDAVPQVEAGDLRRKTDAPTPIGAQNDENRDPLGPQEFGELMDFITWSGLTEEQKRKILESPEATNLGKKQVKSGKKRVSAGQPQYLDLVFKNLKGMDPITEAEYKRYRKERSFGKSRTPVPNPRLAQYAREILFETDPERFRDSGRYDSLEQRMLDLPAKNLSSEEIQTLNDALRILNSTLEEPAKRISLDNKILKQALEIIKDYAEHRMVLNQALENFSDPEKIGMLNIPGGYSEMLARYVAANPKTGALSRIIFFNPMPEETAQTEVLPDEFPVFVDGQDTGKSIRPSEAIFTGDAIPSSGQGEFSFSYLPNQLYLNSEDSILRSFPFRFRNRYIPNSSKTNVVPFEEVMFPSVSIAAYMPSGISGQAGVDTEENAALGWARASGLMEMEIPNAGWKYQFASEVFNRIQTGIPVMVTDGLTAEFVRRYNLDENPGLRAGFVFEQAQTENMLLITGVKFFGDKTQKAEPSIAKKSKAFSRILYRVLMPFFSFQEEMFNADKALRPKEEMIFGQTVVSTPKAEDIVGGGLGVVGAAKTLPDEESGELTNFAELQAGEERFRTEAVEEDDTQKTQGEVARQNPNFRDYADDTEGKRTLLSMRQHMLIPPEMVAEIRKYKDHQKFVRMIVLPEIYYLPKQARMDRKTGNTLPPELIPIAPSGSAIVIGVTNPATGEYLGDTSPIPTRAARSIALEEDAQEASLAAAAAQPELAGFSNPARLPKNIGFQDVTSVYVNLLNFFRENQGPVQVAEADDDFAKILMVMENVISFDVSEGEIYITGVFDPRANQGRGSWIGQLPYGHPRYEAAELANLGRDEVVELGGDINKWLTERKDAKVDTVVVDDSGLSDEEVKNRVLYLQVAAQSYLENFGGEREAIETFVSEAMAAAARAEKREFLETVDDEYLQLVEQGLIDFESDFYYRRLIQDAVLVFNTGLVFNDESSSLDASKTFVPGVAYADRERQGIVGVGRPREIYLARVRKIGIPEQEANNLVDRLSFVISQKTESDPLKPRIGAYVQQATGERKPESEFFRRIMVEAILVQNKPGNENLKKMFAKIRAEYEARKTSPEDESYLDNPRPTRELYSMVFHLAGYGIGVGLKAGLRPGKSTFVGVVGLTARAQSLFKALRSEIQSPVSLDVVSESIKGKKNKPQDPDIQDQQIDAVTGGETEEKLLETDFTLDPTISGYDAQKGLLLGDYDPEETSFETLNDKARKNKNYEIFAQKASELRESLPFVDRAIHDIIMRQGYKIPHGFNPRGKSGTHLDLLFPFVKIREGSQIGEAQKGKAFLSGKFLSYVFAAGTPGLPTGMIEESVLREKARERDAAIRDLLEESSLLELADLDQVKAEIEKEDKARQEQKTALRKKLKASGMKIAQTQDPEELLEQTVQNLPYGSTLSGSVARILRDRPASTIIATAKFFIERMVGTSQRNGRKVPRTLYQLALDEIDNPIRSKEVGLDPEILMTPEEDKKRVTDILFNAILPVFSQTRADENLNLFPDIQGLVDRMAKTNAPFKQRARQRVNQHFKDVFLPAMQRSLANENKHSVLRGSDDRKVVFDPALLFLANERENAAMDRVRAAAATLGIKNVRFSIDRDIENPMFVFRGSEFLNDPLNSTIYINPARLADKIYPQTRKGEFASVAERTEFERLSEVLARQLVEHEVAHLAYFQQIRQDYLAAHPEKDVSFDTYYRRRIRDVAGYLRDPNNGLQIRWKGEAPQSVQEVMARVYPQTTTNDEMLVAEFFRILLELDKSGGRLFTEGIEFQRSLQTDNRQTTRANKIVFLEWLRTVMDSLLGVLKTLQASLDPRAKTIVIAYGKVSALYHDYFRGYVNQVPDAVAEQTRVSGMFTGSGEVFQSDTGRQLPIGAAREETFSRRFSEATGFGKAKLYQPMTDQEIVRQLVSSGAVESVEDFVRQMDPDKVAMLLLDDSRADNERRVETTFVLNGESRTFMLNTAEKVTLARLVAREFARTGQLEKAATLVNKISQMARTLGQVVSSFRLMKDMFLENPQTMVAEYVRRLAGTRGLIKEKVQGQIEELRTLVKSEQLDSLRDILKDTQINALLARLNQLYGPALAAANMPDIEALIRQHYEHFSGEKLTQALTRVLGQLLGGEKEQAPLLFELADLVEKNMLTQLGRRLSLRGRAMKRNIVRMDNLSNEEKKAARIEQIIEEMQELVKPPVSKTGSSLENAIAGDARKLLELAALGALNDDTVLAAIESLGSFPSFNAETAQQLHALVAEATTLPANSFMRDRKLNEALRVLHRSTQSNSLPIVNAYYYMSLLSGIGTFWVNFVSTQINMLAQIATYSIAAANARGNPLLAARYMSLGFKTFLAGLGTIGYSTAKGILLTGEPNLMTSGKYVDENTISALESIEPDSLVTSALSAGKYVFRIMQATDALFGWAGREGFAAIQAAIQAEENIENGITSLSYQEEIARLLNQTDEFFGRAQSIVNDETRRGLITNKEDRIKRLFELRDQEIRNNEEQSVILKRAEDLSLYGTFNNKPEGVLGGLSRAIEKFGEEYPVLKTLFVPFTKIVANVTNESINYTPYGLIRAYSARKKAGTSEVRGLATTPEEYEQIMNIERANLDAIKALIGTGSMFMVYALSAMFKDEDDDGQDDGFVVTGSGPKDPADRRQWLEAGYKPFSVQLFGNSVKFNYLVTPLAMPLAIVGTWTDADKYPRGRDKSTFDKLVSAGLSTVQVPFNQSFLQGLTGLFRILDASYEGQDRATLEKLVSGTIGIAVPNLFRQIEDVFEPVKPTQTGEFGQWVFGKIPIVRNMTGRPTVNVLGEEINVPAGPERFLFLQRLFNTGESDPLFKLLASKNSFIPDARRGVRIGNLPLDDDQYWRLRKIRGEYLARVLRTQDFYRAAVKMNKDQLEDYLDKLSSKATERAKAVLRDQLLREGVKLY